METREEKRWKMMQDFLLAEGSGHEPKRYASQKTLFGIKSTVEETIEKAVAETEASYANAVHVDANEDATGISG